MTPACHVVGSHFLRLTNSVDCKSISRTLKTPDATIVVDVVSRPRWKKSTASDVAIKGTAARWAVSVEVAVHVVARLDVWSVDYGVVAARVRLEGIDIIAVVIELGASKGEFGRGGFIAAAEVDSFAAVSAAVEFGEAILVLQRRKQCEVRQCGHHWICRARCCARLCCD